MKSNCRICFSGPAICLVDVLFLFLQKKMQIKILLYLIKYKIYPHKTRYLNIDQTNKL